jgi:nucleoside-diphosphate-sugar epimerase
VTTGDQSETLFRQTKMGKPNVLILGGCGFIGKNLATHLVEKDIAGKIRVVDKGLPATAYLTGQQQKAFDKVEFRQGNLGNPGKLKLY